MNFQNPAEARKDLASTGVRRTATFMLAVKRHRQGIGTQSDAEAAALAAEFYFTDIFLYLSTNRRFLGADRAIFNAVIDELRDYSDEDLALIADGQKTIETDELIDYLARRFSFRS